LAYRFIILGRDLKAPLVVKIKGRGRSGYFDGSGNYGGCGVKCGLKTGLYAQTSGSGLVKGVRNKINFNFNLLRRNFKLRLNFIKTKLRGKE